MMLNAKYRALIIPALIHAASHSPALAQEPNFMAQGKSGNLTLIAGMTNDPDWLDEWMNPTGNSPRLTGSSVVQRGEEMHFTMLYSGAQTQANNKVSLDCALALLPPGSDAPIGIDRTPCSDQSTPDPSLTYLAEFFPKIGLPADMPKGPFRAQATLWDNLSGDTVTVEFGVEVQ